MILCGRVIPEDRYSLMPQRLVRRCIKARGHIGRHRTKDREWADDSRFSLPRTLPSNAGIVKDKE